MATEIERKFLVDHEKWKAITKPEGTHYRQGYLLSDDHKTIRVRTTHEYGFITIKGSTSGISRQEFEYKIPVEDGRELLDSFAISELDKICYRIEYAGKIWEVDEFSGKNAGLIVAEIELQYEHEEFEKPTWVTDEVSDDARYYNSNLAVKPFSGWQ